MTLFVTSSPYIDGAPKAILSNRNQFVDRIRECLPENPRVVFVASDPDDHSGTCSFAAETCMAFLEAGIPFSRYEVLTGKTAAHGYGMISHSDLVVLSGGHVPTQNEFFQEIHLKELLENYQGVILGISAGTMNAAARVYAQPEEAGESVPEFRRFLPGLGITHVNVLPHYQQVKDYMLDGKRLFEDVTYADSYGERFFVFVDGTYLLIEDDQTFLYGQAYRLQDGQMEQISELGDIVVIEE